MKKILKIVLWSVLALLVLIIGAGAFFVYKITYGFPVSYETEAPDIEFPQNRLAVLLFSKTTGFRHGESIEAGKKAFKELAEKNNWFLYDTEEGGVFNEAQLAKFNAVVFNNCTGRLLNKTQQKTLENYVGKGGNWIGIHGAGDFSHWWDWYEKNLVGARFSHHALEDHLQKAEIKLNTVPDTALVRGLPASWTSTDEWYVFYENPRKQGFQVIYAIDGEKINPNGNLFFLVTNKDFGMGKDHPVAWYRSTGKGHTFYTSMGHDAEAWKHAAFIRMLENEINAAGKRSSRQ